MANGLPDDVSLCNDALARFGAGSIADFEEDTDLAELCVATYFPTVEAILSEFDWQQLRKTTALQRLADPPANGWRHGFAFPTDAITGPRALLTDPRDPRRPLRAYALEGRSIFCDQDKLWGVFGYRLSPDQWQPALRLAITLAVASALCVPVTHDKDTADNFYIQAFGTPQEQRRGGATGRALVEDHNWAAAYAAIGEQTPADDAFWGA